MFDHITSILPSKLNGIGTLSNLDHRNVNGDDKRGYIYLAHCQTNH